MEQENKAMKVLDGITGLTQQSSVLNRFCLTASLLRNIFQEFLQRNNIGRYRSSHYQLTQVLQMIGLIEKNRHLPLC